MKLHSSHSLTKVLPIFRKIFPSALVSELEKECLPAGDYVRCATPRQLVEAMLRAMLLRLSSQSEIVRECPGLGLSGHCSLSYDLQRPWFTALSAELNHYCAQLYPSYDGAVHAHPRKLLDTMPVLIQATQRGTCAKYNNVAKGCGVMASFNLDAGEDQTLVEIVKILPGGWNDTYQVRNARLVANGPIYIADRGFYSLQTTHLWTEQGVHFILRAKKQNLSYSVVESLPLGQRQAGAVRIESDEIVQLGKPSCAYRSKVRLLKAWLDTGEDLWLVSDQLDLSAPQLLEQYLQRGKIEVYHRFVKQSLGAAHLYSFDQHGIETQIQLTALLANLLFLAAGPQQRKGEQALDVLINMLAHVRQQLGVRKPWKRNTVAQRRAKPPHNRRHLKRRFPTDQNPANL